MTARSRPTRASDSSVAIRSIRTSSSTLPTRGSLPAGTRSRRSFDFRPQGSPEPATQMTELPRGDQVLARAIDLRFRIGTRDVKLKTPSPVDFVLMKLDAMRIRRPVSPKDAFDLYAYVRKKTPAVVAEAIASAPERGEALGRLQQVFGDENADGVRDVLTFAGSLDGIERELVAKDVVRTFATVRRLATIG